MRKALTDLKHDQIKAHILDPDHSPLSQEHQQLLDRVISMSKVLDKNPVQKQAMQLHQAKYPHIGKTQAFEDFRLAVKLFNTLHTFDYDFWQTWLINDIVRNIERARRGDSHQDRRVIAMEHANLLKAIGEKPQIPEDPHRAEKHEFYILVNVNNESLRINMNQLQKLPGETLRELNRVLFSGGEITDVQAQEIMNS